MTDWKTKKLFTVADGLLLLFIALLALAAVFFLPKTGGEVADVYVGGELVCTLSLEKDGEYVVPTRTGKNVVAVKDGKVYMKDADCPDKSCVHAGKTDLKGSVIACLPHGVKIVVRGTREGVDG